MALGRQPTSFETYSSTTSNGNSTVGMRVYEPKEPITTTPTVIANGWGTGTAAMARPAARLAEQGYPVVTFDHNRVDSNDPIGRKVDTLAAVVCAVANLFDSNPARLRAYSEGLMHAARVASQAPCLVERVEAVSGFGLVPTTVEGLMGRVCQEISRLPRPNAALANAAFFGAQYAFRVPMLTMREVCSVAGEDALPDIGQALRMGVPFSFAFLSGDHISPLGASVARLEHNNIGSRVTITGSHGGHFAFLFSPGVIDVLNDAPVTNPVRAGRPRKNWSLPKAS